MPRGCRCPAAHLLSMVFIHQPLFAQDDEVLTTRKPCLELVLPPGPPAGIRSAELEFATSTTLYTPLINQNPSSANMLLVKNTHDLAAGVLGPGVSRERLAQEPVVADLLVFELV